MYNESYEEYIRNILGYPNYSDNSYSNIYNNGLYENLNQNTSNKEIEKCYPEIYKIIYPRVKRACRNCSEPMTPDLIERMTDDIYSSIEADNIINVSNVNINLTNEIRKNENRNVNISKNNTKQENKTSIDSRENRSLESKREDRNIQNRGEDRQFRNRNLRDLIKILLIRELLGGIGNPGGRPPMPPPRPPMRPTFPGGPGNPHIGPRPPYDRYKDIYEY